MTKQCMYTSYDQLPLFLDAMDIAGAETLALEELKKSILDK